MPAPAMPVMAPDYRAAVIDAAMAELAAWPGHFGKVAEYLESLWATVLPQGTSVAGLEKLSWCGCFALHCLKAAGLGCAPKEIFWVIGQGFLGRHCTPTTNPQPGDIAYFDRPYQHHAIVEAIDGDTIHLIAGNTPGVSRSTCPRSRAVYYSIEPLIDIANGS